MKSRLFFCMLLGGLSLSQIFAQPRSISNVRVAPHDTIQSETAIAIHPLDNTKLITDWNDEGNGFYNRQKFAYSPIAGAAFTFIERNEMNFFVAGFANYSYTFDPSISYDRNGNVFASYISVDQSGVTNHTLGFMTVAKSTNNGYSWSPVKISSENSGQDKPWNTVDNTTGTYSGRIYASWTDFTSGSKIKFAYSTDGGISFSTPSVLISKTPTANKYGYSTQALDDGNSNSYVQYSMPAVGPNGYVYVVWANLNSNTYNDANLQIARSTNGGVSFGDPVNVAQYSHLKLQVGNWKVPSFPSIAVDQTSGVIYIAYVDEASQSDSHQRIKMSYSVDQGQSFTLNPVTLPTVGSSFHTMPTISIDDQSNVSVAFVYTSGSADGAVDVYYTYALGGIGFSTPVRASSQSSNVTPEFYTDYMHMVSSTDGHRYISWTDNRATDNASRKPNTYVGDINFGPATPQNLSVASYGGTRFQPGHAQLSWTANTEPEMQQSGAIYEIYRKIGSQSSYGLLTTVPYNTPTYTDNDVNVGSGGLTVYYRIRAKGSNNYHSPYTGEVGIGSSNFQERIGRQPDIVLAPRVPEQFEFAQNYPNPFNPTTRISYGLPEAGIVHLTVFDCLGRDVATLVNEYKNAGYYDADFDASNLSSGIYFYRIQAGNFTAIKKMLLMK